MANITFKKDEEHKIIIRKIVGEISAPEVIETFQTIVDMVYGGFEAVGVVNDLIEGSLNVNRKEISDIGAFLKNHVDVFKNLKMAACVTTPSSITIPLLVARQVTKINIKAFSTVDAAYDWILSYD